MPFNLNLKKILIVITFIAVSVGIGFAIYFMFFRVPPEEIPAEEEVTEQTGGLPAAGLAGPRAEVPTTPITEGVPGVGLPTAKIRSTATLSLTPAKNIELSFNGTSVQYYNSAEGIFYRTDEYGSLTPLSNKKFFQVENVTWSLDKSKAVLEYPDGSNIVYNFKDESQTTLPKHWEDFEFSPDGTRIISKSMDTDPNSRWLVISDLNGSNIKAIAHLGDNADKVQVAIAPNEQIVGFSRTGDPTGSLGIQEIFLLGQNNENFKSLKVNGLNFKAQWAEEGDRILYSVTDPSNDYKPVLWAVDVSSDSVGTNAVKINLDTWIDKCAIISGYKAYCAVPKALEEGAGFSETLPTDTDDVFYFVDLKTGTTNLIAEPEEDYAVEQISVSQNEDYIYFTDSLTGNLHTIEIRP